MRESNPKPMVAIACGGTGGHLFPGVAVADQLLVRGAAVTLLVSPKEVDQQVVGTLRGVEVVTLPAVGLTRGRYLAFLSGFIRSYRLSHALFERIQPSAALAMGGFTSAAPVFAAHRRGVKTCLHESNTFPGRANRWLARWVDDAFVYFDEAARRLKGPRTHVVGMPVRPQFEGMDAESARISLGLRPQRPTLLVMGGSQGASGINQLVTGALPLLKERLSKWQFIHLTGAADVESVRQCYARLGLASVVRPFLSEMEYALGAATLCVSRSGASSLAELAAMSLPAVLIPYPTAADDHQRINARAFVDTGAAWLLDQGKSSPKELADLLSKLAGDGALIGATKVALSRWHFPGAAEAIADFIAREVGIMPRDWAQPQPTRGEDSGHGESSHVREMCLTP
jgi:UDP-N-acetylglucosamine--N-acetylmuramyl-(pentapeptide) pyrophosphoryl-undecaprenol N-acetylglucosamine transferase